MAATTTSKVLFTYIEATDKIEYGDFTVKTGIDNVKVLSSSGQILHNGNPIGGGGGPNFLISGSVVKCNLGIVGSPEENAQTIRVPLAPFIIDAGEGALSAPTLLRLLTIEVVDDNTAFVIMPNFTFNYLDNPPSDYITAIADNQTRISGASIGRRSVDPITGKNLWTVLLNMGEVHERYPHSTLMIGVTFDTCSTQFDSFPIV